MAKSKRRTTRKPARTAAKKAGRKRPAPKPARKPQRKPMVARRADLGAPADSYFAELPDSLSALAARLRDIVRAAAPTASEAIKWGMPVYELSGKLCYIRAWPAYVTLGFYESGAHLADPARRLEGTGANMRHCKIRTAADIDPDLFTAWVTQAAAINADA